MESSQDVIIIIMCHDIIPVHMYTNTNLLSANFP